MRNKFNACFIFASVLLLSVVLFLPRISYAQGQTGVGSDKAGQGITGVGSGSKPGTVTLQNPLKVNSVSELVNKVAEIFSYLAIIFAVLAIIWVGFQFILAQGKPDRMNELKMWLFYIMIGVAIILGARLLIWTVINTLSATGTVNQSVINSAKDAASGNQLGN